MNLDSQLIRAFKTKVKSLGFSIDILSDKITIVYDDIRVVTIMKKEVYVCETCFLQDCAYTFSHTMIYPLSATDTMLNDLLYGLKKLKNNLKELGVHYISEEHYIQVKLTNTGFKVFVLCLNGCYLSGETLKSLNGYSRRLETVPILITNESEITNYEENLKY